MADVGDLVAEDDSVEKETDKEDVKGVGGGIYRGKFLSSRCMLPGTMGT